jgi:hypothetical protein
MNPSHYGTCGWQRADVKRREFFSHSWHPTHWELRQSKDDWIWSRWEIWWFSLLCLLGICWRNSALTLDDFQQPQSAAFGAHIVHIKILFGSRGFCCGAWKVVSNNFWQEREELYFGSWIVTFSLPLTNWWPLCGKGDTVDVDNRCDANCMLLSLCGVGPPLH